MVGATVIKQRAAVAMLGVQDFGDQDGVVAGIYQAVRTAFERGQRAGDQRHALVPGVPFDRVEPVVPAPRKMYRKILLALMKNIDTQALRPAKALENVGTVIDADQNQRRIERNRCKRVRGHAVRAPLGVRNRDDGDAGGKSRAGPAKGRFIETRWPRWRGFA